ncbi:hypothetical protein [Streptomyces sp. NPDC058086]|uniref:hypothetical protein n=1 Tax=Streptomyces sp. NPDC058086 TaxID=3346334 RepID=UPI0036E10FDD
MNSTRSATTGATIGYHFLIDHNGKIYEGRWSGNDGTPAHDKDGKVVTALKNV